MHPALTRRPEIRVRRSSKMVSPCADGQQPSSLIGPAPRRNVRYARQRPLTARAREPSISAAVCAFSLASRITQCDGVAGRGHAGKPHLAAPGDRERTGGLRHDVPGPERLPKPGSLDDARLAPFRLPRIARVSRHPVGSQPSRRRPRVPSAAAAPPGRWRLAAMPSGPPAPAAASG